MTFDDYRQRVKAARRASAFSVLVYLSVVMAFFILFLFWVAENKQPWTLLIKLALIVGAVLVLFLPLIPLARNGRRIMSRYGFNCPNCKLQLVEYNASQFVLAEKHCPQCGVALFDGHQPAKS